MLRGRLLQRFLCSIRQLDTEATSTVVGGGYDPLLGEPIPVADGTQTGSSSRREKAAVDVPCQVDRREWGEDVLVGGGHDPETELILTFHFRDLERLGLVHTSGDLEGKPKIGARDRVERLKRMNGNTVVVFPDPPGMYVTVAEQGGWGIRRWGSPKRNLLIVRCRPERRGEH